MQVGNGLLADTPGFNVPSLTNLTISNLQACFPEIERRMESHRLSVPACLTPALEHLCPGWAPCL